MSRLMVILIALGLAAPLAAQTPPPSQPLPVRGVTVVNETEQTLFAIYIFPPGTADRGADRLGSDVIEAGNSFRVTLRTRNCAFDIQATFADGTEETRRNHDICRNTRIVFGDPDAPRREVTFRNGADMVLRELYVSEAGPSAWGNDRLGSAVIEPGAVFNLRLRSRGCSFALRGVWADNREEVREGVDLCAQPAQLFDRASLPRPQRRTLELVNRHLATVEQFYLSPSSDGDWGPDRLGSDTLGVGASLEIGFEAECLVDLRAVFPNGGAEERREVDICATNRLVLAPGWVVADPPAAEARPAGRAVRNLGSLPIVELYVSAPGSATRGPDRLVGQILAIGGTFDLPAGEGEAACRADLAAIFRDGREALLPAHDICTGEEIPIR